MVEFHMKKKIAVAPLKKLTLEKITVRQLNVRAGLKTGSVSIFVGSHSVSVGQQSVSMQ
jgi:hypothetical protein